MTTTMIIRIDEIKKEMVAQMAKREGKSVSILLRELIDSYLKERDVSLYVDDLWSRIGKRMKDSGVDSEEKVNRLIHKVRRERAK